MNLLARDPLRRERLGAAAYDRLRRDFSAEGTLDLLAARLRELLGERAAAPRAAVESAAR
jgi:hypothetical protein